MVRGYEVDQALKSRSSLMCLLTWCTKSGLRGEGNILPNP